MKKKIAEILISAIFFDFWHKFETNEWRQMKKVKILLTFTHAYIRILCGEKAYPCTENCGVI